MDTYLSEARLLPFWFRSHSLRPSRRHRRSASPSHHRRSGFSPECGCLEVEPLTEPVSRPEMARSAGPEPPFTRARTLKLPAARLRPLVPDRDRARKPGFRAGGSGHVRQACIPRETGDRPPTGHPEQGSPPEGSLAGTVGASNGHSAAHRRGPSRHPPGRCTRRTFHRSGSFY